jgi:hypothetical protein
MNKVLVCTLMAAALPLAACDTTGYNDNSTLRSVGTGAAIGGALGAGAGAAIGGLSILEGAAIGAAVGGLAGAVWADRNNDGRTDGYEYNGQYYEGVPAGYRPAAGCGPVGGTWTAPAAVGTAVPGLPGATWADVNNDGCVDGYTREGAYYSGAPVVQQVPVRYTGERG